MPQTFTARAADTWTHLTEIAFWYLFLVRKHQAFIRFGWQKVDAPVTPRRVRRAYRRFCLLLARRRRFHSHEVIPSGGKKDDHEANENGARSSTKPKKLQHEPKSITKFANTPDSI
jgi:hypothetical protein